MTVDGTELEAETEAEAAQVAVDDAHVERALEGILMVADEPMSVVTLATAVGAPVKRVRAAIDALVADYDGAPGAEGRPGVRRGFELREVGGGWRIYVRPEYDAVVSGYVLQQNPTRLSQAALETLAVIAYKQPISRGAIASIRAVNVDSVVRTLLGRGLITELFTDSETGAINYGTTDLLLTQLGINSIDELPKISPLLADGSDGFDDVR
ncbi:SMC-Scp complex subunit ScpB [uncultured Leifsonia sp.]|uniref:SMC-Scp complex subunit ScpB n=1 Tax=uncultured Leifsonia sp. TaxID=340359 RepID=UPI0025DD96FA|nr:SMC-Scp complex subunit ScpB [uncultured Leifsonia sp.]